MRWMFGIGSLLVVVAIMMYSFTKTELPVVHEGQKAQQEAQTIAGRGADGQSALQSASFEAQMQGSQLKALRVTKVTPGGAMEQHFGLRTGDSIVQIGDLGTDTYNDEQLAEAQVLDAFQGSKPLVVLRDGQRVTLPTGASSEAHPSGLPDQLKNLKIPGQ